MRAMTFSKFHAHFYIVKLPDLVSFSIAVTVDAFHLCLILSSQVNKRYNYNTRSASNMFYSLPKVRTNYGLFHIRFKCPKVWNSVSEDSKTLSISNFKESMKSDLLKDH